MPTALRTPLTSRPRIKASSLYRPHPKDRYAAFVKDKRCIVVGPAGYMSGRKLGKWIDSFDLVVKLNWGETLNHADFGSRTDVLYKRLLKLGKADEILIQDYLAAGIKWIVAVDSPLNTDRISYLHNHIGERIDWYVENETRARLSRELGTSALIGTIAVRHLLDRGVKSVTITGCDFTYGTGYAEEYGGKVYRAEMKRREGIIGPTHDGPKQLRWLMQQRSQDKRIQVDDYLEELMKSPPVDKKLTADVAAVIPARYQSSRFPGKPLALINGKPMILHVCERVSKVIDKVIVATDDERIYRTVRDAGYKASMTTEAMTGTDRVAQVVKSHSANIYVNVQGDEPLIDPAAIMAVIEAKKKYPREVINAMTPLQDGEAESRDVVKAVVKAGKHLAYCSRAPVPYGREGNGAKWKQLGLYAFSSRELQQFASLKKRSELEAAEDVEILRFVDMGIPVRMVVVGGSAQAVDKPEHIALVEKAMKAQK